LTIDRTLEPRTAAKTHYGVEQKFLLWPSIRAQLRSKFVGDVVFLSASTAVAQAFTGLLAPLLTRLYSPSDLGSLALFTSFLGVASVGVTLKYELGIISARTDAEAAWLTWASILVCVPVSVICGGIMYGLLHFSYLGFGVLPRYAVALMVVTLVLTGTFISLRYWAIREGRFGIIGRTVISQQAGRSISQTALGFLNPGAGGLFAGEFIGRIAGVTSLLRCAWPSLKNLGTNASWREITDALHHNRTFAMYSVPSSLLDTASANMIVPLLVQLYGSAAGGQFALVQSVVSLPMVLIAASVADTFHNRLALYSRQDPGKMLQLFNRTTIGLLLVGLVPAAILFISGERLFSFAFGKPWAVAGTLAAIVAPAFLAQVIVSPLSRLVFVLRGQRSKLIYDIALMISLLVTFQIASRRGWSIVQTVGAFTVVNTLGFVLYYLLLLHIILSARRLLPRTTGPN
jgi:O-antigen/teichoic acid export membrane protein